MWDSATSLSFRSWCVVVACQLDCACALIPCAPCLFPACRTLLKGSPHPPPPPAALPRPLHRMQDAKKGPRSIPMGDNQPHVFVGLDDSTVVVGFCDMSPLQVWDLAAGELVREFEGKGQHCYSMANLPGGRIAAGWNSGPQFVVAVFDAAAGKQLQELTGFGDYIYGLALVEDHLLVMCSDKTLRVWSQDSAGKVRRQCACPRGKGMGGRTRARCECVPCLSPVFARAPSHCGPSPRLYSPLLQSSRRRPSL